MKARGKLVSLLMALVCLLPIGVGLLGFGDSASAAVPEKVKVTLHKKKMDDFPTGGHQNTGEVDTYFDKYDPLPGVKFQTWDITEDFYDLLKAEGIKGDEDETTYKNAAEGLLKTVDPSDSAKFPKKQQVGTEGETNSEGKVEFPNLPSKDENGVYKVYWFEELNTVEGQEFGQPVILMLPVLKVGSQPAVQNDDIHLYPKNKLPNKPEKELLDDDGTGVDPADGPFSYDVGKQIKYKVTYQIPLHIGETIGEGLTEQTRYSKLTFKDEVTHPGVRFVGFESMKVLGATSAQDVDVKGELDKTTSLLVNTQKFNFEDGYSATGKAGFELAFKLDDRKGEVESADSKYVARWLNNHAGKTLEIVYAVQFTEDTPIDEEINNTLYVDLQQNGKPTDAVQTPDETPPPIHTGGKKFIKYEYNEKEQVLKGAEFVITTENGGKYLTGNANEYTWKDVVDDKYEGAIKLTSGENGYFEIKGLAYDTYKLVEIKAPNGYEIGGPVTFIVNKNSYKVEDTLREGIPNVSRGGFLPSTGGIGIAIFLIIGGSLMAFAVSRYRKQQHAA